MTCFSNQGKETRRAALAFQSGSEGSAESRGCSFEGLWADDLPFFSVTRLKSAFPFFVSLTCASIRASFRLCE